MENLDASKLQARQRAIEGYMLACSWLGALPRELHDDAQVTRGKTPNTSRPYP